VGPALALSGCLLSAVCLILPCSEPFFSLGRARLLVSHSSVITPASSPFWWWHLQLHHTDYDNDRERNGWRGNAGAGGV
jgi:hypothetical protein